MKKLNWCVYKLILNIKMIVNFFTVKQNENSSDINILYKSFGENIPKYLTLEGGSGDKLFILCK